MFFWDFLMFYHIRNDALYKIFFLNNNGNNTYHPLFSANSFSSFSERIINLHCCAIDCSLDSSLVLTIIIIITKYNNLYTNYVLWTINDNSNDKDNESLLITRIIIIINPTTITIIATNDNNNLYTLLSLLRCDLLWNNKNKYIYKKKIFTFM